MAAVTVKEKGVLALDFSLSTNITSVPIVPATVEFSDVPPKVSIKVAYWYMTFFTNKELDPLELLMSIELSPNLSST